MKGTLVSGTGRGSKFIAMPVYFEIFKGELGKEPFCGTLNLQLEEQFTSEVSKKFEFGTDYSNLITKDGNHTGGIIVINVKLKNNGETIESVGVRPKLTSHDQTILEVVASKNIRTLWGLDDGDQVEIEI